MIIWVDSMKSVKIFLCAMGLLAACAPVTQDTPGQVVLRGDEVIIVGPVKHGRAAAPTNRMVEQAKEACPTARYVSARPSLSEASKFDFLFAC